MMRLSQAISGKGNARDCGHFSLWAFYSNLLARHGAKELNRNSHGLPISIPRTHLHRPHPPGCRAHEDFRFGNRPVCGGLRPQYPFAAGQPPLGELGEHPTRRRPESAGWAAAANSFCLSRTTAADCTAQRRANCRKAASNCFTTVTKTAAPTANISPSCKTHNIAGEHGICYVI